jgi:putative flavoprotein involved in K+ transport
VTAADPASTCLVVGAGPAGLATAACLRAAGVSVRVVDRAGEPGGAYREIYHRITLASPAALDSLPGLPLEVPCEYATAGDYHAYLLRYAARASIAIERAEVQSIRRDGGADGAGRFLVDAGSRSWSARFVVVATGMWGAPVIPRIDGLATCGVPFLHARDWRGPRSLIGAGGPLLVIGGASSAVEIAEEAAEANLAVTLAVRSRIHVARQSFLGRDVHHWIGPIAGLPSWIARGYCANRPTLPGTDRGFSRLRAGGKIVVRPALTRVDPGGVAWFADGARAAFAGIVAATGYEFATPFLPAEVARAPAGHVLARQAESVSWPGLFVVGTPCADRLDSEFLRGMARDAATVSRKILERSRQAEPRAARGATPAPT